MTEQVPQLRVTLDLTVTTDELAALFSATFTQEQRIAEMIKLATDAMLMDVITPLTDELAMVRSARRKIEVAQAAFRVNDARA